MMNKENKNQVLYYDAWDVVGRVDVLKYGNKKRGCHYAINGEELTRGEFLQETNKVRTGAQEGKVRDNRPFWEYPDNLVTGANIKSKGCTIKARNPELTDKDDIIADYLANDVADFVLYMLFDDILGRVGEITLTKEQFAMMLRDLGRYDKSRNSLRIRQCDNTVISWCIANGIVE